MTSKYRIEHEDGDEFWCVMFEGDEIPVAVCGSKRVAYAEMLDAMEYDGEELPKPEVSDEMIDAFAAEYKKRTGYDHFYRPDLRAALEAALGEK
jgi:hypothetical protein